MQVTNDYTLELTFADACTLRQDMRKRWNEVSGVNYGDARWNGGEFYAMLRMHLGFAVRGDTYDTRPGDCCYLTVTGDGEHVFGPRLLSMAYDGKTIVVSG